MPEQNKHPTIIYTEYGPVECGHLNCNHHYEPPDPYEASKPASGEAIKQMLENNGVDYNVLGKIASAAAS